jgi:hypothetical protein
MVDFVPPVSLAMLCLCKYQCFLENFNRLLPRTNLPSFPSHFMYSVWLSWKDGSFPVLMELSSLSCSQWWTIFRSTCIQFIHSYCVTPQTLIFSCHLYLIFRWFILFRFYDWSSILNSHIFHTCHISSSSLTQSCTQYFMNYFHHAWYMSLPQGKWPSLTPK